MQLVWNEASPALLDQAIGDGKVSPMTWNLIEACCKDVGLNIAEQSRRMNTIVENITQLSRRDKVSPVRLPLQPWLEEFMQHFAETFDVPAAAFAVFGAEDLQVCIDPDQFYQVVGNLASLYYWLPGERDRAMVAYEKAAQMAEKKREINPRKLEILTDLTEYYAALGRQEEAFDRGQEALALDPDNWDSLLRVGVAYETLGARDSALAILGRALQHGCPVEYFDNLPELEEMKIDPRFKWLTRPNRSAGR